MLIKIRAEDISMEPEWRDALVNGNEHTTIDTGKVTLMIFGLEPNEAKALSSKLSEGMEIEL